MSAMTLPVVPDWLKLHAGDLTSGVNGETVFVRIGGQPEYRLDARPAGGKYVCNVIQTVNGRLLGDGTNYETADTALAGGLEALRNILGW
jgi:hypothetical protein